MLKEQDANEELDYQKRQAQTYRITKTPDKVIERYRTCTQSVIHPKERMFELVHECKPNLVCDFGCGGGESSTEFAALGYSVVGVDISPEMIEIAKARAEVDEVEKTCRFLVGSAPDMDWTNDPVDLIFIEGVLHHLVDVEAGLKCLDRILKPGGFLVIQEPVAFSPFLRFLRKLVPVKTDLSPNERQLLQNDIELLESYFPIKRRYFYRCLTRLERVFGSHATLSRVDNWINRKLPFLRRYFGTMVILAQKTPEKGQK